MLWSFAQVPGRACGRFSMPFGRNGRSSGGGLISAFVSVPDAAFDKLTYFSFKGHFDTTSAFAGDAQFLDGTRLPLSRSGYTGEVGFEIFVEREHNVRVWELLMDTGKTLKSFV